MSKQTIQIEISRSDWTELSLVWLTAQIAQGLSGKNITRLEVKQVKNK